MLRLKRVWSGIFFPTFKGLSFKRFWWWLVKTIVCVPFVNPFFYSNSLLRVHFLFAKYWLTACPFRSFHSNEALWDSNDVQEIFLLRCCFLVLHAPEFCLTLKPTTGLESVFAMSYLEASYVYCLSKGKRYTSFLTLSSMCSNTQFL